MLKVWNTSRVQKLGAQLHISLGWTLIQRSSMGEKWKHNINESESEVTQSCLTLCDPMNCNLSGSFVHGIFQARVLEWIAISISSGSSRPRSRTPVSHITGRSFTIWVTREAQNYILTSEYVEIFPLFISLRSIFKLIKTIKENLLLLEYF